MAGMTTHESSPRLERDVTDALSRFDVRGVVAVPNDCADGWAVVGYRRWPVRARSDDTSPSATSVQQGIGTLTSICSWKESGGQPARCLRPAVGVALDAPRSSGAVKLLEGVEECLL